MPARRLPTLRNRFALAFAALFFLMAAVLAVITGNAAVRQIEGEAGRALGDAASQIADKLDRDLWARRKSVGLLASLDVLRDIGNLSALRHLVDGLKNSFDTTAWVGFTDKNGIVVAGSDRLLEGADISHRPVFREGIAGNYIGDVHDALLLAKLLPNPSGEPMKFVDIATPVTDAKGDVVGTLGAHLSWNWALQVRTSVLAPQLTERAVEGLVIAADGTVLLGPGDLLGHRLDLAAIREIAPGTSGYREETWPDGHAYLTGYARSAGYLDYPGLGWTVLVRQPVERAYAGAVAVRDQVLSWAAAFSLVFAVAGWFAAGWISGPLTRIAATADRIRDGEDATIPDDARIAEIHTLAISLRALVESLGHKQRALDYMEDKAHRDGLTGLANRAEFERQINALAARSDDRRGFACLYLDLDGFKPVNDTYGHGNGDLVLQEIAARLRETLRGGDVVARLGGDEFVLLLPGEAGSLRTHAAAVAERVIAAIGAPIRLPGEITVSVGCSIGFALWPDDAGTVEELIGRADVALYAAKRGGRNRAVAAGDRVS